MSAENTSTRVLIVDDSALVRRILTGLLASEPTIEVVGSVGDPFQARDAIKELAPDVLTLDVQMPRMDGITFLRNLMRLRPMPVVMVSSLTEHGAEVTLDALRLGAVDYLAKPHSDIAATLGSYREELIMKVKMAARARVRRLPQWPMASSPTCGAGDSLSRTPLVRPSRATERIIAMGASTGGTEAIREVLSGLPPDMPGILISQHIPRSFSAQFARRMNACCPLTVSEAEDGQPVMTGHVYIAPGDRHLVLTRDGTRYVCALNDAPRFNRHRPSVDLLFRSVAEQAGRNAIGVILTGMGRDGAAGLKQMRGVGAATIAQDEASSVVWGMPGAAVELGAACHILPLGQIGEHLQTLSAAMEIARKSHGG